MYASKRISESMIMNSSQSSLMASSSSSSSLSHTCRHRVFASFHGKDVRKTFLSHLRKQFDHNGITMFDDQRMERSHTIGPVLTRAIRESRISIVMLSKKYASSSWCLDELVEIFKCKKDTGQIVMPIFYDVDPSDVRKQTGDFGKVFKKTCAHKTEKERRRWSKALTDVGNIAGEHFLNWDNEAKMIERIAKDVLDKLNATPSRDFDGMVGLEAHLKKMEDLLDLDYDGVKMVAISGPIGIGKTTIARALHSRLSNRFQLTCFVDNLRESYQSGFDEYGLKMRLQQQFLSKILNQNGMRICHLGAIEESLCDHKVLIILDGVNNRMQLEALANETTWFGHGSRVVVTTENKELLQQHGINNMYDVRLPSYEQALKILCRYASRQSDPHDGFEKLAKRVTHLCGNLPLALSVVGSSLRGKKEDEWEDVMNRLENILDRDIEDVLRVGYDSLDENEKTLFLHIAIFFNHEHTDLVKAMFANGNLDVKRGLKILVNRSLIELDDHFGFRAIHKLLWQLARQAIQKQKPWERQILINAHEICNVFENETGNSDVSGILFDISGINELIVGNRTFKRLPNLQFLKVYKSKDDGNDGTYNVPKEMEFPRRLRLLHWEAYPNKFLPPTFHLEYLVVLNMKCSNLEYLWQGSRQHKNLKKMDLSSSFHLKELPDLSTATNLEELNLRQCVSLVEIPSSFCHLQKLKKLTMVGCINLQVTPPDLNLASLEDINMRGCSKLRNLSIISTNLSTVNISETSFEDVPPSFMLCSGLGHLRLVLGKSENLKRITHLPRNLWFLDLSYSGIKRIPDCIKSLRWLYSLNVSGCRKLVSLSGLPCSLSSVDADDCESLETVFYPLNQIRYDVDLRLINCFSLGKVTRREIIRRSFILGSVLLPGGEMPAEFDHRAIGNSLTIRADGNNPLPAALTIKFCIVLSPNDQITDYRPHYPHHVMCRRRVGKGDFDLREKNFDVGIVSNYRSEHVYIFDSGWSFRNSSEVSEDILFEFSSICLLAKEVSKDKGFHITECGAHVRRHETIEDCVNFLSNRRYKHSKAFEDDIKYNDRTNVEICEILEGEERTDCWSWLFHCFDRSWKLLTRPFSDSCDLET